MPRKIISIIKNIVKLIWRIRRVFYDTTDEFLKKTEKYPIICSLATPVIALVFFQKIIFHRGEYYIMILPRDNIFNKNFIYMPEFFGHTHHKYMVYYKQLGGSNYIRDDFQPSSTDVAVDVGAYMGRDAAAYARIAKQVISIEASPRNIHCASRNLSEYDNIKLINKGAWNEKDEIRVQYGHSPSDDSLIEPDDQLAGYSCIVSVDTLENILTEIGVNRIGFLKIEAEGAEPEVIRGFGGLKIRKVVISSNEERYGDYSYDEVVEELEKRNFNIMPFSEKGRVFAEGIST